MKPFLMNIARFAVIQLCIGAVLLVFAWDNIDRAVDYDASIIDKHALLENQPSPRLVLVGGSNVAFGFNSNVFHEKLGVNPINMATHAAMGRQWVLEDVVDGLREGDVVIVSLEYEAFSQYEGDFPNVLRAIRIRPGSIRALSWEQTRYFMDEGFRITGSMMRRGFRRMKKWDFSPAMPLNHAYTRRSFNEYGDNIGALDPTPVKKRLQEPKPIRNLTADTIDEAIADLNDFARECEERGARVFFVYSPVLETHYRALQPQVREIDQQLRAQSNIPVLTTPEEMVVGIDMIFDAKEHLTFEGATWRSELVAERLEPYLK